MKVFSFLMLISVLWFASGCSSDETTMNAMDDEPLVLEAEILLNQSYGTHPQQTYDLYLPEARTAQSTKVILLIHGGGWTSGDKADMTNFVISLRDLHPEYAIVNMNYVLATLPDTPAFPNQFLDIERLITTLTTNANTLQILPEFGMIGVSAGAHLALQYDYVYDDTDQVKFVVDIVGPTDFTDPFYTNDPQFQMALDFLVDKSQYPPNTDLAIAVSPAKHVSNSSSPTLQFYGDNDPLVPLTNGERLDTALTNSSITHTFTIYEGGHGNNWSAAAVLDLENQISTYINTYLEI
ncbi:alpha/beta hydrolase fold domain-containing protein [Rasiella sp. SM2506]|uniref:alpha/beta hydrolase fold domain-containing protein n=1 Tax=Rasiella sp. SM2506 TaxID=3423914 RepID=UPI003D78D466